MAHNRRDALETKDKEKVVQLATSIKSRSTIKDPTSDAFVSTGKQAAKIISSEFISRLGSLDSTKRILDFGCGSGRVALNLLRDHKNLKLYCNDVDAEAVEFLSLTTEENCIAEISGYMPPLSYPDEFFDGVYAVSVWSHFPKDLGMDWLKEMYRICKPGAVLLITVAGENILDVWKKSTSQWDDVQVKDFNREKFIYREFKYLSDNEKQYPGIAGEGSWGNTLIHSEYIYETWSEMFEILAVKNKGMNGNQDLVIMRKQ